MRFEELLRLVDRLFGKNGCPWDREQTLDTMKKYIIEEAHETAEAIEEGDSEKIKEEIGDLFIQAISLAKIAEREGFFGLNDALIFAKEKLVRRHPHVFSDLKVKDVDEVLANWERIKRGEKKEPLSVPYSLPGLLYAARVSEKIRRLENRRYDIAQVEEAFSEFKKSFEKKDGLSSAVGKLIFLIVNIVCKELDVESAVKSVAKEEFASASNEG
jgi:MazG family protein